MFAREMHSDSSPDVKRSRGESGFIADFMRYAVCGVAAVAVDYSVFGALSRAFSWGAVAAQAVSRPCGGIVSFILNRQWTFRGRGSAAIHTQMIRFAAVWITMYGWSLLLVWMLNHLALDMGIGVTLSKWLAKMGGDGVAALTGFLLNRFWTFGGRRQSAQ